MQRYHGQQEKLRSNYNDEGRFGRRYFCTRPYWDTLPAYDSSIPVPYYKETVGLRIVDLKGIGLFILNNPQVTSKGLWETKTCTGYSLEREFVNKSVYFEKNVYNLWNPIAPQDTVLGILMERFPTWSVGTVDDDLVGKYRSLDETNDNGYNVMKSTLQDAYGCIFDFDTYKRRVNVRSVNRDPATLPISMSLHNLIKELEVNEDDDNIATCLTVRGADGVDVSDVNPMGGSKIYDFDYIMTGVNFTPEEIRKYRSWKDHFTAMQEPFYNLTVEQALKESQAAAESARLTDIQGELKALEGVQATWIELLASHNYSGKTLEDGTPADEAGVQRELSRVNEKIKAKKQEIAAQQAVVDDAKAKADKLQAERQAIVDSCQLSAFFTGAELLKLDPYIKENEIEESSFAAANVKNYNVKDLSSVVTNATVTVEGKQTGDGKAAITATGRTGSVIYSSAGGRLSFASKDEALTAELIRMSVEVQKDNSFTLSAYLSSGGVTRGGEAETFPSGTLVLTGASSSVKDNGTKLVLNISEARFYFTQNVTEWERRSVAWDLLQYGQEVLKKVSQPSYHFNIKSVNFLVAEEFEPFKNALSLGERVYLRLNGDQLLRPVVIGVTHDFDRPENFELEFSSKYSTSDQSFQLVDLLEQSVSMGKKLDVSREVYDMDMDEISAWIDTLCDMSRVVNAPTGKAG